MKPLINTWHWSCLLNEVLIRDEKIDPSKMPEKEFYYIGLEDIESNTGHLVNDNLSKTKGCNIKSIKNTFYKGDVLYGRLRPALNKVYHAKENGICSTDIWVLKNSDIIMSEYMFYYINMPVICDKLSQSALGGQLPRVPRAAFGRVPIPVPSPPEQQRIVDILKQADALRRQRREILEQTKKLSAALFLEMFGDPRDYSKKWGTKEFGYYVTYSKYGPRFPNREYSEAGARILRTTDMEGDGTLRWWDSPVMSVTKEELKQHTLQPGTLLVSRSGTIGPIALFTGADEPCIAGAYLIEFGLSNEINHQFIIDFFLSDYGQAMLTGGSQSMTQANLNAPTIKKIKIPTPPKKLRDDYYKISIAIRDFISLEKAESNKLEELSSGLIASGFSGDLTKSWREAHIIKLEAWLRENAKPLQKKAVSVSFKEDAPPERTVPTRPTRTWLIEQLSEVQNNVFWALREWKGTLIPSEDLDSFINIWPVEHLDDEHDHILRALNQLAGLGLIARVSVLTQSGEYVTGYRLLREEELTKVNDLERLGGSA